MKTGLRFPVVTLFLLVSSSCSQAQAVFSTLCLFTTGAAAGQVRDYAPLPPLPVGNACSDGMGSFGYIIAPPTPPPTPTAPPDPFAAILQSVKFNGTALVKGASGNKYREAFGVADNLGPTMNGLTTRFRLGSLSKQFTATAVLALVDQNLIQLNTSICAYLDACPPQWNPIQIIHLLQHTSGIPDFTSLPTYSLLKTQHTTSAQMVTGFKAFPLAYPPGINFRYSNSEYVILGYIVERIVHQDLGTYMAQTYFVPRGMTNTGYDHQNPLDDSTEATGYSLVAGALSPVGPINMTVPGGAGGFFSTVDDLSTWLDALLSGKILSAASLHTMLTPGPGYAGCGWFIKPTPAGHTAIYHIGTIDGFENAIVIDGATKAMAIVLSNVDATPSEQLARALMVPALSN